MRFSFEHSPFRAPHNSSLSVVVLGIHFSPVEQNIIYSRHVFLTEVLGSSSCISSCCGTDNRYVGINQENMEKEQTVQSKTRAAAIENKDLCTGSVYWIIVLRKNKTFIRFPGRLILINVSNRLSKLV